jgi:hypothetical protein
VPHPIDERRIGETEIAGHHHQGVHGDHRGLGQRVGGDEPAALDVVEPAGLAAAPVEEPGAGEHRGRHQGVDPASAVCSPVVAIGSQLIDKQLHARLPIAITAAIAPAANAATTGESENFGCRVKRPRGDKKLVAESPKGTKVSVPEREWLRRGPTVNSRVAVIQALTGETGVWGQQKQRTENRDR